MENFKSTSSAAVTFTGVVKQYRLFKEKNNTLKGTITKFRRTRYEEYTVINDVSLTIHSGTAVGIIGSNGSGKSTLLKTLAGIVTPDSGRVETHGRVVALLELGAGFHPELSGRENIYLNGAILGMTRREIESALEDIIAFAELGEYIDVAIKHYSSGMIVRLGFAIAAHVEPDILIVDEVLSVGDEAFQNRSLERIKQFRDEGRTIILVSHAVATLVAICDRLIWLDKGEIVQDGSPNIVADTYLNHQRTQQRRSNQTVPTESMRLIQHVSVSDGSDNTSGVFGPRTALLFRLILSDYGQLKKIFLVICITDRDHRIVWQNHDSRFVVDLNRQQQTLTVECKLLEFPISEGIFTVSFRAYDHETSRLLDEWEHETLINVTRNGWSDYGFCAISSDFSY